MRTILWAAVALIVGLVLFQVIAQETGSSTNTVSVDTNITAPANGATYTFTSYKALNSVVVTNASGGETIGAGNYTISNNQVTDGALSVVLTVDDAAYATETWNIVATGQPLTYISESGGRALAGLIPVFFALMLVAVALYPVYESKLMELFGR